ncbi:MAG: imidazole glycerol phosphate synthase subunit HisH [Succinivibrionaceae bacterium]
MAKPRITIIDTGCANFTSVKSALDRLEANSRISSDLDDIRNADKLILPGVGTAKAAMSKLRERNLSEIIQNSTQPLLGICLGMQLLSRISQEKMQEEEPDVECLNLVNAGVHHLNARNLRLPHMGWDQVEILKDHPLFDGIDSGSYFYFVHSYAMDTGPWTLGKCEYGEAFTAVVGNGNFLGTQFHPEKSGAAGSRLLKNFLEM